VAPLSMIVPGVLNGSRGPLFYPPEQVGKDPSIWNGVPIVVKHPYIDGRPVSAREPSILSRQGIGMVHRAKFDNGKLRAEGWFDVENTKRIEPRIYQALESGTPIELSTGLFTQNVEAPEGSHYNGVPYTHIATNYQADHLAVFVDETGACSLNDGCGVLINKTSQPSWTDLLTNAWSPAARAAAIKARRAKGGAKQASMSPKDKAHSEKRLKILRGSAGKDGKVGYKGKRITPEAANRIVDKQQGRKRKLAAKTPEASPTKAKTSSKSLAAKDTEAKKLGFKNHKDRVGRTMEARKEAKIASQQLKKTKSAKQKAHADKQAAAAGVTEKSKNKKKGFTNEQIAGMKLASKFRQQGASDYARGKSQPKKSLKQRVKDKATQVKDRIKDKGKSLLGRALSKLEGKIAGARKRLTGNTSQPTNGGQTVAKKLKPEAKTRIINDLIANTGVGVAGSWEEADREALNAIPDLKLAEMDRARQRVADRISVTNAQAKPACTCQKKGETMPTQNDAKKAAEATNNSATATQNAQTTPAAQTTPTKPATEEEWLASAPPSIRSVVANAMRLEQGQKAVIVDRLVANVAEAQREAMKTKYMAKSLDELNEIASLIPQIPGQTNNSSAPLFVGFNHQTNNAKGNAHSEADVLTLPRINWGAEVN